VVLMVQEGVNIMVNIKLEAGAGLADTDGDRM
jgi:hypothetical protein